MEKLYCNKIQILFQLFQFSSLLLLSSAYILPDQYFINCGSDSNTTFANRTFIGDNHYRSCSFFPGNSSEVIEYTNTSNDTYTVLYQTARIYRHPSSYEFTIPENGTYILRLHFHVSSPSSNLSSALFNVSTSQKPKEQKNWTRNLLLLSNFSVSHSTVVKEFLLPIIVGKFKIHFIPSQETSLAFVNAIEVFVAPEDFIDNKAPYITPAGRNSTYNGLLSQVLQTVHRINVGGEMITPEHDTLLRNWIPDDDFLVSGNAVKKGTSLRPAFESGWATEYIAPVAVYESAKELNSTTTWHFNVSNNARHLVRVHFCDVIIVSPTVLQFYLYIYSKFRRTIDPYNITSEFSSNNYYADWATPFYYDFVVDSDNSGFMNISVGPSNDSQVKTAFLNGVEIMELMKESGLVPIHSKPNKMKESDLVPCIHSKPNKKESGTEPNKKLLFVIVGSVVGVVAVICILLVVVFGLKCRKAKPIGTLDRPSRRGGSSYHRKTERTANSISVLNLNLGLKKSFSEMQNATRNFNKKLMIGEGGYGKVYKGTLRNGMKVAVKRSEPGHGQGLLEFQREIMVSSKIRHRHLVSLIGYCDERSEMILVYEFMEKGTLRENLYGDSAGSSSRSPLSWEQRINICIDSARGLHYLHTDLGGRIIHRDVKSTNILLDENYVAKVADFGLSRSITFDQTNVSTDVKGSFGYLDPEYFKFFQLTDKSDIYSFGVVLLEVLCARPPINHSLPREQVNLAEWGMSWQMKGQLDRIIDPLLLGKINPNSLRKFGETADKCLKERGVDRPTMGDVLWDLEFVLKLQQTAVHREPYEDSIVDTSLELPSQSVPVVVEDKPVVRDDVSFINSSEVFSELKIVGAR